MNQILQDSKANSEPFLYSLVKEKPFIVPNGRTYIVKIRSDNVAVPRQLFIENTVSLDNTELPLTPPNYEDFRPSPAKPRSPFRDWPARSLAFQALFMGLLCYLTSLYFWSEDASWLMVSGKSVFKEREFWRLGTALFAHSSLSHLASNMLPFLFFGWMLRAFFGRWMFPVLSLIIGLVSNLITVSFYPPETYLLGASGMVYGMVGLWLVLYIHFEKNIKVMARITRVFGFCLLLLVPQAYEPHVSYLAHASGFTLGVASGVISAPFVSLKSFRS